MIHSGIACSVQIILLRVCVRMYVRVLHDIESYAKLQVRIKIFYFYELSEAEVVYIYLLRRYIPVQLYSIILN